MTLTSLWTNSRRGVTILELVLAVALGSIVVLITVKLYSSMGSYIMHLRARQKVTLESRSCLDTIVKFLRNAKARTISISSSNVPNSRVDFTLQNPTAAGTKTFAIFLQPDGKVYTQEDALDPRAIASNVTFLMFTSDSNDPGSISVSLRIDAPWDTTDDPTHVSTFFVNNQVVHLSEAPH